VPAKSEVDFYDLGADSILGIYVECQALKQLHKLMVTEAVTSSESIRRSEHQRHSKKVID